MLLVKGVTLPATAFWAAFAHDWLLWFGVLFVVFASEILPKVRFVAAVYRSLIRILSASASRAIADMAGVTPQAVSNWLADPPRQWPTAEQAAVVAWLLKEQGWQLTRREFRVFRNLPEPIHIVTFWVRVPEEMGPYFHLVNSEAEKAVREELPKFQDLSPSDEVKLWLSERRDFRLIEMRYRGALTSNGCRVWLAETLPNGLPFLAKRFMKRFQTPILSRKINDDGSLSLFVSIAGLDGDEDFSQLTTEPPVDLIGYAVETKEDKPWMLELRVGAWDVPRDGALITLYFYKEIP
jgi:hypothetical protein